MRSVSYLSCCETYVYIQEVISITVQGSSFPVRSHRSIGDKRSFIHSFLYSFIQIMIVYWRIHSDSSYTKTFMETRTDIKHKTYTKEKAFLRLWLSGQVSYCPSSVHKKDCFQIVSTQETASRSPVHKRDCFQIVSTQEKLLPDIFFSLLFRDDSLNLLHTSVNIMYYCETLVFFNEYLRMTRKLKVKINNVYIFILYF